MKTSILITILTVSIAILSFAGLFIATLAFETGTGLQVNHNEPFSDSEMQIATGLANSSVANSKVVNSRLVTNRFMTAQIVVQAKEKITVCCNVDSRGHSAVKLIQIAEDGMPIRRGETLAVFDSFELREKLSLLKLQKAREEASLLQAKNDLQNAKFTLEEFEDGLSNDQLASLERAVQTAREKYERLSEYVKYTDRLTAKGYILNTQARADHFSFEMAKSELELARNRLAVYKTKTRTRLNSQYQFQVANLKARQKVQVATLELTRAKIENLQQQIASCTLVSPTDGFVQHVNAKLSPTRNLPGTSFQLDQPVVNIYQPSSLEFVATCDGDELTPSELNLRSMRIQWNELSNEELLGRIVRTSTTRDGLQISISPYELMPDFRPGFRGVAQLELLSSELHEFGNPLQLSQTQLDGKKGWRYSSQSRPNYN